MGEITEEKKKPRTYTWLLRKRASEHLQQSERQNETEQWNGRWGGAASGTVPWFSAPSGCPSVVTKPSCAGAAQAHCGAGCGAWPSPPSSAGLSPGDPTATGLHGLCWGWLELQHRKHREMPEETQVYLSKYCENSEMEWQCRRKEPVWHADHTTDLFFNSEFPRGITCLLKC